MQREVTEAQTSRRPDEQKEQPSARERTMIVRQWITKAMRSLVSSPGSARRQSKTTPLFTRLESLEVRSLLSGVPAASDINLMDNMSSYRAELTEIVHAMIEADGELQARLEEMQIDADTFIEVLSKQAPSFPIDKATWKQTSNITGALMEGVHPGTGNAYQATIDSQGKWMYTSAGKGPVQKVNASTGATESVTFLGHTHLVTTLAISPDGSKLVTGSHDKGVRVYDTSTGALLQSFTAGNTVSSVQFLADGKRVAALGINVNYTIFNIETGETITKPTRGWTLTMAVSNDMSTLIYNQSNKLTIVNLATGAERDVPLSIEEGRVGISGDSSKAFVASSDGTLTSIDLKAGKILHSTSGLGYPMDIAVAGNMVSVVSTDNFLRLFESTSAGFVKQKEYGTTRSPRDVSMVGKSIITLAANDGTGGGRIARFEGLDAGAASLERQKSEALDGLEDLEIMIKDIATDLLEQEAANRSERIQSFVTIFKNKVDVMKSRLDVIKEMGVLTPEVTKERVQLENRLAIHSETDAVKLDATVSPSLDVALDPEPWTLDGKPNRYQALVAREAELTEASNDLSTTLERTELMILTNIGDTTALQNLKEKVSNGIDTLLQKLQEWNDASEEFDAQAWGSLSSKTLSELFPENGNSALSVPKPLTPLDSAAWKQSSNIPGSLAERIHPGAGNAYQATVDSQGKWIYTSAGSGRVQKVSTETGAVESIEFTGHTNIVTTLAISPDGSKLVTGSHDKGVRIYDTSTGVMIGSFTAGNIVNSVQFLADNKSVAALGINANYAIYNSETGVLKSHATRGDTLTMAVSPDMSTLVYNQSNKLTIVDLASGTEKDIPLSIGEGRVGISGDGEVAFVAASSGILYAVDTTTGTVLDSVPDLGYALDIAVDGKIVATSYANGLTRVFEYENSTLTKRKEYSLGMPVMDVSIAGKSIVALPMQDGTGGGRIVRLEGETQEFWQAPSMSVVEMKGGMIVVAVDRAEEGDSVVLDNEGILSSGTVHIDPSGQAFASLAMNSTRPSGDYALTCKRNRDGIKTTVTVKWDKEAKTLALKDTDDHFLPSAKMFDDGSLPLNELFSRAKSAEDASMNIASARTLSLLATSDMQSGIVGTRSLDTADARDLLAMQKIVIAEKVDLSSDVQILTRDFEPLFYRAFPHWKEENKAATMASMNLTGESFIRYRKAELSEFRTHAANFDKTVCDLIARAMNITLRLRCGIDVDQEVWHLNATLSETSAGFAGWLGLKIPSSETLFTACNTFLETQGEWLRSYANTNAATAARMDWAFNNPNDNYAGSGEASPSSNQRAEHGVRNVVEAKDLSRAARLAMSAAKARGLTGVDLAVYEHGITVTREIYTKAIEREMAQYHSTNPTLVADYTKQIDGIYSKWGEVEGVRRVVLASNSYQALASSGELIHSLKVNTGFDMLTAMNRDSLQRLHNIAEKGLENAIARDALGEIAHWSSLLEATDGLISVIPAGMDEPDVSLHPRAQEWKEYVEKTTTDPIPETALQSLGSGTLNGQTLRAHVSQNGEIVIGKLAAMELTNYSLDMKPETEKKFIFELTGDSMVNLWVPGATSRDLTLRLSGKTLEQPLISKKSGLSGGESISLRLPKGVYTFTIADLTDYAHVLNGSTLKQINFHPETNMKIDPYNSADIEGRVSIDGSKEVMPVSMRVAKFNGNDRITDYNAEGLKNSLDPSKPVWVVVHGRNDSETGDAIQELSKNISKQFQVVTVGWSMAAEDNEIPMVGLEGSKWIEMVGAWTSNQLKAAGFNGNHINIVGHSWGTYVSYEIGLHIPGGIHSFVALDPAAHSDLLQGKYDPKIKGVDFSSVAERSYALHSSDFGNDDVAKSAEHAFTVDTNMEGYEFWLHLNKNGLNAKTLRDLVMNVPHVSQFLQDKVPTIVAWMGGGMTELPNDLLLLVDKGLDAYREHGFAVTAFSNLIDNNGNEALNAISLGKIMQGQMHDDPQGDYDGSIIVDVTIGNDSQGKEWWKAKAKNINIY